MAENHGDLGNGSDPRADRDTVTEKAGGGDGSVKRQSGRPPARPPYEQNLRVSKVSR